MLSKVEPALSNPSRAGSVQGPGGPVSGQSPGSKSAGGPSLDTVDTRSLRSSRLRYPQAIPRTITAFESHYPGIIRISCSISLQNDSVFGDQIICAHFRCFCFCVPKSCTLLRRHWSTRARRLSIRMSSMPSSCSALLLPPLTVITEPSSLRLPPCRSFLPRARARPGQTHPFSCPIKIPAP